MSVARPLVNPGHSWAIHAPALAAWTDNRLVNRRDVFGRYIAVEARRDPDLNAFTVKEPLTLDALQRHFKGASTGDVIGLHSTSRDEATGTGEVVACWSRWGALDIDRHDDATDPEVTEAAALYFHRKLVGLGLLPLLLDSNGNGGFHLVVIFEDPAPTADVYHFLKWLTADWARSGLASAPETFPKQPSIEAGKFGNWLRLPGRHHTRNHFTRVWSGRAWLEGAAAIKAIVSTKGDPASFIPPEALVIPAPKRAAKPKRDKAALDLNRDERAAAEALGYIAGADDYDRWIEVGQALACLGSAGLNLWDGWSADSAKYQDGACERKWRSFRPDGPRTLGTLFHLAKQNGYPGQGKAREARPVGTPTRTTEPRIDDAPTTLPIPDLARPEIRINTEQKRVNDQAIAAVAVAPNLFQRAFALVRVLRDVSGEKRKRKGARRPAGTPMISVLPLPTLREMLAEYARWTKTLGADSKFAVVPAHPPDWSVTAVAARGEWPDIRPIEGVVEAPTLRPDGSILDAPGYDEATALLYEPNAIFPPIPDRPSIADARKAADELQAVVVDFPFATDDHKAVWLAAVLTVLARHAIEGPCPLFLFDANTPGSGKTKLADLLAILATGREMARVDYPEKEEEMAKLLLATAIANDSMILFDNVQTGFSVGGKSLDRVLTAGTTRGRVLGKSEMTPDLPVNTVFFATGNNLGMRGDALRRVVPCRLESKMERPEERTGFKIKGDILAYARRERCRLVVAGLTILRAYFVAGKPEPKLTPIDYPAWCETVRNAVHWATGIDPCETRKELVANDPETAEREALARGWFDLPEGRIPGLTAASALKLLKDNPGDHETLRGVFEGWGKAGELPSSRVLGKRLRAIQGRVIKGLCFESKTYQGTQLWRVEGVPDDGSFGGSRGSRGSVSTATQEKTPHPPQGVLGSHAPRHSHDSHDSHETWDTDPNRPLDL